MRISGVLLPLTTPFVGGAVAADKIVENIERYEKHDPAGYVMLGSSGEAAFLSEAEKVELLRAARAAIPPRKPMVAGVGLESTAATVKLARTAADCGADMLLVITPHFFKSKMTDEALKEHFLAVADASSVPILVYNNPTVTGVSISAEAIAEIAAHERIAGVKDSSGNLGWMLDLLARVPDDFIVLSGSADILAAVMAAGASGGILAAADILPEPMIRIWKLCEAGKTSEANALQKAVVGPLKLIHGRHGVAGIKAAMDARGLYGGPPRKPLLAVRDETRRAIGEEIDGLIRDGIIPTLAI